MALRFSDCPGLCTQGEVPPHPGMCSRCGKHVALYLVGTLQGESGAFYLQGEQMLLPHLDCLSFPVKKRGFLQVRQEAAALARTVPSGDPRDLSPSGSTLSFPWICFSVCVT